MTTWKVHTMYTGFHPHSQYSYFSCEACVGWKVSLILSYSMWASSIVSDSYCNHNSTVSTHFYTGYTQLSTSKNTWSINTSVECKNLVASSICSLIINKSWSCWNIKCAYTNNAYLFFRINSVKSQQWCFSRVIALYCIHIKITMMFAFFILFSITCITTLRSWCTVSFSATWWFSCFTFLNIILKCSKVSLVYMHVWCMYTQLCLRVHVCMCICT